jgi:hypothetical protein
MALTAERGNTGVVTSPSAHHRCPVGIDHRDHAAMPALDEFAAGNFNENWVGHGLISWRWLRVRGPYERTL